VYACLYFPHNTEGVENLTYFSTNVYHQNIETKISPKAAKNNGSWPFCQNICHFTKLPFHQIALSSKLPFSPVKIQFDPQKIATKGFSTDSVGIRCTL
jgi:hypothetical protein